MNRNPLDLLHSSYAVKSSPTVPESHVVRVEFLLFVHPSVLAELKAASPVEREEIINRLTLTDLGEFPALLKPFAPRDPNALRSDG